jgi:SAM-dependent methyltransferase
LRFERLPIIGKLYTKNEHRFPPGVHFGDVTRGLPVQDGLCDGVYCSHVLEHLSREDFERAIRETFRILKPGGIFRLVVPDLESAARAYVAALDAGAPTANDSFLRSTLLGSERRRRGLPGVLTSAFGNSEHLWMWDWPSLNHALGLAGFTDIRRARMGDSEDPMFREVEEEGRFVTACAVQTVKSAP